MKKYYVFFLAVLSCSSVFSMHSFGTFTRLGMRAPQSASASLMRFYTKRPSDEALTQSKMLALEKKQQFLKKEDDLKRRKNAENRLRRRYALRKSYLGRARTGSSPVAQPKLPPTGSNYGAEGLIIGFLTGFFFL